MWFTIVSVAAFVVFALSVLSVVFGHVYRLRAGYTASACNLLGKTIIITGASAGIGKEAARDFATRGARVIMACRNMKKAEDVAADIRTTSSMGSLLVKELDTSSLSSVRAFAQQILKEEKRVDALVLNAGTAGPSARTCTADGLELTMATNHFGHFLLANLLLGLLKESSPSRIVVSASGAHVMCKELDVKNLNYETGKYWSLSAYARSKLCNILFARQLSEMLKGTGVVVNALCPGLVSTEIFKKAQGFVMKNLYGLLVPIVGKTELQGAQTIIHLTVAEETADITGKYFEDCQVSDNDSDLSQDSGLAKKVWDESEKLVGLKQEEQHF